MIEDKDGKIRKSFIQKENNTIIYNNLNFNDIETKPIIELRNKIESCQKFISPISFNDKNKTLKQSNDTNEYNLDNIFYKLIDRLNITSNRFESNSSCKRGIIDKINITSFKNDTVQYILKDLKIAEEKEVCVKNSKENLNSADVVAKICEPQKHKKSLISYNEILENSEPKIKDFFATIKRVNTNDYCPFKTDYFNPKELISKDKLIDYSTNENTKDMIKKCKLIFLIFQPLLKEKEKTVRIH